MKRRAIIIDLDGTLCNKDHRHHLYETTNRDWKAINEASKYDTVNEWCLEIVNLFSMNGYKIVFLTGRSESSKEVTMDWLVRNVGYGVDWELHMRPGGDTRMDTIVKNEIYFKDIATKYDVLFAIDDRKEVVDGFRDIGLVCLDVASAT